MARVFFQSSAGTEPECRERQTTSFRRDRLNRNPPDNIPRHAPAPPVLNLRGVRVGVPGEVLNSLEGHVLIEEIGHDRDPEAVRGEAKRGAGARVNGVVT